MMLNKGYMNSLYLLYRIHVFAGYCVYNIVETSGTLNCFFVAFDGGFVNRNDIYASIVSIFCIDVGVDANIQRFHTSSFPIV